MSGPFLDIIWCNLVIICNYVQLGIVAVTARSHGFLKILFHRKACEIRQILGAKMCISSSNITETKLKLSALNRPMSKVRILHPLSLMKIER